MNAPVEVPAFLKPSEPPAVFSWWSTGRMKIVKNGAEIDLSADDLREMNRFACQIVGERK